MIKRHPFPFIAFLLAGLLLLTCIGGPIMLWVLGGGTPNVAVDYVAKMNERAAAVPEDERAWPIYLEVIADLHGDKNDAEYNRLVYEVEPGSDDWGKLVALFDERRDTIAKLRRAASMPGRGLVMSDQALRELAEATGETWEPIEMPFGASIPLLYTVNIDHLGQFRHLARVLNADARVAIATGEPGRFVDDIEAMLGLAGHMGEHPTIIDQLVEVAIRALAFSRIRHSIAAHSGEFTDSHLARLDRLLAGLNEGGTYQYDLDGERWYFYDWVQRLYTDDGNGDGQLCAEGISILENSYQADGSPAAPSFGGRILVGFVRLYSRSRAEIVSIYDQLIDESIAWAERPLWERGRVQTSTGFDVFNESGGIFRDYGLGMISMALPALSKVQVTADMLNMDEDAARVVIALERHRLANGRWPASLDELIPAYLDRVPVDQFDGRPMRYVRAEGGCVLYSVGMDRKDDGGRQGLNSSKWVEPGKIAETVAGDPGLYDGDLVFFPPPGDSD